MGRRRVAVLADVHGNAVAVAAVLEELEREQPDAVVHCGDLTWGPLPAETMGPLDRRDVLFVRGNADRARDRAGPPVDRPRRRGDGARALDGGAARPAPPRAARRLPGHGRAPGRGPRRRALL